MANVKRTQGADDAKDAEQTERDNAINVADVAAEAEAPAEPEVLSRQALLNRSAQPRPAEVIDGLRVRGLSRAEYQRMNAARVEGALEKGGKGLANAQTRSDVEWLMAGVVEPKMAEAEWLQILDGSGPDDGLPAGQVDAWVAKIKELSGIEDMEVALAKKLLAQNLDALRS